MSCPLKVITKCRGDIGFCGHGKGRNDHKDVTVTVEKGFVVPIAKVPATFSKKNGIYYIEFTDIKLGLSEDTLERLLNADEVSGSEEPLSPQETFSDILKRLNRRLY